MGYTAEINKMLQNSAEVKVLFPQIALMTLPKKDDGNYISFRKNSSECSNTLDNYLHDRAQYIITAYAEDFDDLEELEGTGDNPGLIIKLFNGQLIGKGVGSIISIGEDENLEIKKYVKIFTLLIA